MTGSTNISCASLSIGTRNTTTAMKTQINLETEKKTTTTISTTLSSKSPIATGPLTKTITGRY